MKRKIMSLITIFVFIFCISSCSCDGNNDEKVSRGDLYVPMSMAYLSKDINGQYTYVYPFNTTISLTYFYESEKNLAQDYFKEEFSYLHQLFDRHYYYFNSQGNLINNLRVINESNGETIIVEQDLIDIFKVGIEFTKLSNGKFNIGIGTLSDLWEGFIGIGDISEYVNISQIDTYSYQNGKYTLLDSGDYIYDSDYDTYINISEMKHFNLVNGQYVEDINGNYVLVENIAPSEEQIEQAKLCTPTYLNIDEFIVVNDENNTITINKPSGCNSSISITLGALAKSYAAEKIASDERLNRGNFLINAGQSTIKILGKNLSRDNGDWNVGITDSYLVYSQENKFASYLMKLQDPVSVSTSSGDEKHYWSGDNYYHHIIDPTSGYPNQNRFAVTAITSNAMYADIITTSLMNMNMDETKAYLTSLKEIGINVEIFIQEKENDFVKVYLTNGLKDIISKRESESLQSYIDSIVIEEFSYDS